MCMAGVLICLMFPMHVQAGDINGNEASVISAANGTFSYDGKEYKALGSALGALQDKLASDGVDLTAEQAAEAIARMNASVGQGVSEGYLYNVATGEVETGSGQPGADKPQDDSTKGPGDTFITDLDGIINGGTNNAGETGGTGSSGTGGSGTGGSGSGSSGTGGGDSKYTAYAETPIDVQGIIDKAAGGGNSTSGTAAGEQKSGETTKSGTQGNTKTTEAQSSKDDKASSKSGSGTVSAKNAAVGMTYDAKSKKLIITRDAAAIGENGSIDTSSMTASVLGILCIVLTVILLCAGLVCAGVAYRFECYPCWGRKGVVKHRAKKKIRATLRIVLGIALTLEVIGVVAAIGALIGFANNGGVDRNLKISDYYNQVYKEYKEDEAAVLTACGYPENLLERTTVYTTDAVDEDKVLAEMDTYLRKYEELTAGTTVEILISDENRATLELELTNRYAAITASDFIEAMKQSQQDLAQGCMKLLAAMSLLIALDCIVVFKSNRAKQKSVRCTAISVLTAVVLVFAVLAVVLWKKPYQSIVVYPESLYVFMTTFIRWALELYTWVDGAAFAVFCGLMVWWKILEKK